MRVLGASNADIADGDEWLASLDRFGIVSERAVLLEGATLEQNLAMPFTLQIDPVAPEIAERVAALAEACGLSAEPARDDAAGRGTRRQGSVHPSVRARAHLARAVALDPALLVLEHPTADLPGRGASPPMRRMSSRVDRGPPAWRRWSLTQDQAFAQRVAHRALEVEPGDRRR